MQTIHAAQRWAKTWASAWPLQDVEAIVEMQADDGEHWASMFRPFHGRTGLRGYLQECFAEETRPAETWFGEPVVAGGSACVEHWVVIHLNGQRITISGCTVLTFDETGLVKSARDYSEVKEGRHARPIQAFNQ